MDDRPREGSAPPRRSTRDAEAGFTLIEVIVVLSIMGLVMGMVGPRMLGYLTDSKVKTARLQAETLSSAVELFFIDNGRFPLESEGLQALVKAPTGMRSWNGPYLKGTDVPLDPWGQSYVYASPDRGRTYRVTFVGTEGGEGRSPDRSRSTPRAAAQAETHGERAQPIRDAAR
jgi:general secretion pathway protein G